MYVDFSSCCTGNDKYDDEIEIWFIVFSVCLQLVSTLREGLSLSLSCSTWVSLTQLILFSEMLKEFLEIMYISFVQMKSSTLINYLTNTRCQSDQYYVSHKIALNCHVYNGEFGFDCGWWFYIEMGKSQPNDFELCCWLCIFVNIYDF